MSRLVKNKKYFEDTAKLSAEISREMTVGLDILNNIQKPIVTFFGSHKAKREEPLFEHCLNTAKRLGAMGYVVLTGGDSGFSYAASLGANESQTQSVGFHAALLKPDYLVDSLYTHSFSFEYLFARRFLLSIKSEALVFYPGGFSTLNELFEYLLLMEIGTVDSVPIICVGKQFWAGLKEWLVDSPAKLDYFTRASDLGLITIVDTVDEVVDLVKVK
ncbi:MAG: LOG family protein [Patescibacteria group bacterium]